MQSLRTFTGSRILCFRQFAQIQSDLLIAMNGTSCVCSINTQINPPQMHAAVDTQEIGSTTKSSIKLLEVSCAQQSNVLLKK